MTEPNAFDDQLNLSPTETVRLLARDEATKIVLQHLNLCPFAQGDVEKRLRKLEGNVYTLIGAVLASGAIGGTAGALINHAMK